MRFALLGAAQLNHSARQIYPGSLRQAEREVVSRESAEERLPFGLNVARRTRARHPVRMTRHQGRDGCAAAIASRLSRRRSFFFMPTI